MAPHFPIEFKEQLISNTTEIFFLNQPAYVICRYPISSCWDGDADDKRSLSWAHLNISPPEIKSEGKKEEGPAGRWASNLDVSTFKLLTGLYAQAGWEGPLKLHKGHLYVGGGAICSCNWGYYFLGSRPLQPRLLSAPWWDLHPEYPTMKPGASLTYPPHSQRRPKVKNKLKSQWKAWGTMVHDFNYKKSKETITYLLKRMYWHRLWVDKPWKHYAKWKKPDTKVICYVWYDSIYMKYPEKLNPQKEKVDWWCQGPKGGKSGEKVLNTKGFSFGEMKFWNQRELVVA